MRPHAIYLDMDGVLADFEAAIRARGVDGDHSYIQRPLESWSHEEIKRDGLVREIMDDAAFWPSLPLMGGAAALVTYAQELVGEGNVRILTALPSRSIFRASIAAQKRTWVTSWLPVFKGQVITCARAEKQAYAADGAILVDDLSANCAEWVDAGGTAIRHYNVKDTLETLRQIFMTAVAKEAMERITDNGACGCGFCVELATEKVAVSSAQSLPTPPPNFGLSTDAAERKGTPIYSGVLRYFPAAVAEIARVSKAGNDQHNPGQPLHWSKGKSTDHTNCIARHLLEAGTIDTDGQRHSAKVAWRALANLQIELEAEARGVTYEQHIADLEAGHVG